jgi:hypothetical protein
MQVDFCNFSFEIYQILPQNPNEPSLLLKTLVCSEKWPKIGIAWL